MEVTKIKNGYFISQERYIKEILTSEGMANCNFVKTPMQERQDLSKIDGPIINETGYRSVIGKLLFAANHTRPDSHLQLVHSHDIYTNQKRNTMVPLSNYFDICRAQLIWELHIARLMATALLYLIATAMLTGEQTRVTASPQVAQ